MGLATASIIGLGVAVAGSQISSGQKQAKEIQRQGDWNAEVYSQQASMIQKQKEVANLQADRTIARARSTITAKTAGKGLLLSGSPLAVMVDNESQMLFDQAIQNYNYDVSTNYVNSQRTNTLETARSQGRLARYGGYSNAFSTALSTGIYGFSMKAPAKKVG